MDIRHFTVSWISYIYLYCYILMFLCGNGLAALYYNDRRGQPELQQAMDNAPLLPAKNLLPFSSGEDRDYPLLLTHKTSTLLSEALHMLPKIKDDRERKWLGAFIRRLGILAADLDEDDAVKTYKGIQHVVSQPFDVTQNPMPSSFSSVVAKEFKVQTKSKVTSAQVNDVLPVSEGVANREVITKPSLAYDGRRVINDDLVKQLHNQDSGMKTMSSLEAPDTYDSVFRDRTVTMHSVKPSANRNGKSRANKIVNSQIEVQEQKKEEEEKYIRNFLKQSDPRHFSDLTNPDIIGSQKHSIQEYNDKFEMERHEGTTSDEHEGEESVKDAVSPSWQKVIMASHLPASEAQLDEPVKHIVPPEPTMSEEMERDLRDGKIVVLSDSLVRTNFKSNHHNRKLTQ